jgi:4-diphosphocytidyl-2-C-methyl-D-erythritol kinase
MTPTLGHSSESGEGPIVIEAPAKLNLGLEVAGLRQDRFHEIATMFAAIQHYDRLTLSPAAGLEFSCVEDCPRRRGELALHALHFIRHEANRPPGAAIHLYKRTPVASGLGGAMSNAAAALHCGLQL